MDKNTIIGLLLMGAVLIGFTLLNKPSEEEIAQQREQHRRDSIAYALNLEESARMADFKAPAESKGNVEDDFFAAPKEGEVEGVSFDSLNAVQSKKGEETFLLQNSKIALTVSTKGGQIISAQVKNDQKFDGDSLYLFNKDAMLSLVLTNQQGKVLTTDKLTFEPLYSKALNEVTMRYTYGEKQYIDFIYTLSEDDYFVKYDVQMVGMKGVLQRDTEGLFELQWTQKMRQLEKSAKNEQQYSGIRYKRVSGEMDEMAEGKDEKKEVTEPTKWLAFKNHFFASILVADKQFMNLQLETRITEGNGYLKTYNTKAYIPARIDAERNVMHAGMKFYFGPLGYSHLKSYDENVAQADQLNFEELVPLGWTILGVINKYFVIPVFNFLLGTGMSMGIAILLLTLIVKIIISPLTYKSFMSSAKMRVLRPQVEEISAKFSKDQATEKQQAVMALYSKAGANPMSGCIPMLLQMPILIALFRFFPNAIELRQQSFLWADDLSTYDAIVTFPFSIPFLGDHLSLFCILMTITNVIYTKFNMEMTSTGQDQMPGMKWMMYLMPVIFLFVLNDFPSGLTYYYFISLLITILLTLGFRYFVDEEKVLAKLKENMAKPKKKSGFMARLEEAQRMQQQQMKQQNKKKR